MNVDKVRHQEREKSYPTRNIPGKCVTHTQSLELMWKSCQYWGSCGAAACAAVLARRNRACLACVHTEDRRTGAVTHFPSRFGGCSRGRGASPVAAYERGGRLTSPVVLYFFAPLAASWRCGGDTWGGTGGVLPSHVSVSWLPFCVVLFFLRVFLRVFLVAWQHVAPPCTWFPIVSRTSLLEPP